jgi:dCMP deaminase
VAPCEETVHAEENCVAFAARYGISLLGAELHSTDSPCPFCARLIINSGIVRVVFDRLYRVREGLNLLKAAGVQIEQFAGELPT